MPNHPMPRGERGLKKKGMIGRDKAKQWTDCIQCLSYRSVPLEITKKKVEVEMGKFEMEKTATGRCKECGYQTSVSVMDAETYKIIEPVVHPSPSEQCSVPSTVLYETSPDGPSEDLKEALSEGDTSFNKD